MKTVFASDLQPGQPVSSLFLVHQKDVRKKKSGGDYLSLVLGDRTDELEAKMWDNVAEVADSFERDDFVRITGVVQLFQKRRQITVHTLARVDDSEIDVADFLAASERDPDEMYAELRGVVSSLANPHLKGLLEAVFADEDIARRYRMAPAAKGIHHAYLGGLIEHVLSLCHLARVTAAHYRDIDLDLLLAGVILHDFGKIWELSWQRSFSYTTEGQLLGHIMIGLRIVAEKLRDLPGFPPRLRTLLEHMILSHHGELEFGSPKVPLFPEALLLHHLDNLDSKMDSMRVTVERDRLTEGCWTSYNHALDRSLLKKARYMEDRPESPAPPPSEPASADPRKAAPRQSSLFADKLAGALRQEP